MVKTIEITFGLLLAGLTLVAAVDWQMRLPQERRIEPAEYQEVRKLQALNLEFTRQLENITLQDLNIPEGRLPTADDLQCLADVSLWMKGITSGQMWALKMIDAWGSIPSGLLTLNIHDLGNYDECLKISKAVTSSHSVQGQYCSAQLPFLKLLGITSSTIRSAAISIGICFPSSCSAANINTLLNRVVGQLITMEESLELVSQDSCRIAEKKPYDGLAIATIVVLSIFGACAALATFWDYFICKDQAHLPQLVKIWSVRVNSRDLFRIKDNSSNPNVINCLHGMRCMSLIWVVFGHQYMTGMLTPNVNQYSILDWLQSPFKDLIQHAVFSVDTFFFLSGLLVVMIALRSMERSRGKLNIPLMYLHRYLRLTPMVGIAIMVYMSLLPHLVDGPQADKGFSDYSICKSTWYLDILYVQNYFRTPDICLPHSWYLGVDMQLYIISPLFLIALYKWGKKAAYGIVLLIVLTTVWLFTLIMTKNYSMFLLRISADPNSHRWLYFATHLHCQPWLTGAVFGYFLHRTRGRTFQLHWFWIWAGWLICLATMATCVFAMYPHEKLHGPKLTVLADALYYSLTREAWPLALCWVIFACMQGFGGLANSFLSCPLWQPLSKLSFSAYIWHLLIQEIHARRVQTNTYFSDYEMTLQFWSSFGYTVMVSYVTYVGIEMPLGGLESMCFPNKKPSPKPIVEIREKSLPLESADNDIEAATTITATVTSELPTDAKIETETQKEDKRGRDIKTESEEVTQLPVKSFESV